MPVHDWTRVDAGTFHDFHGRWITHLAESINDGRLPAGYYALSEQHASRYIADVPTLRAPWSDGGQQDGGVAVAEAPPKARQQLLRSPSARINRRTLTIRHVSGHRVIALLEIVSPGNKDRADHVTDFVNKAEQALVGGIHLVRVSHF